MLHHGLLAAVFVTAALGCDPGAPPSSEPASSEPHERLLAEYLDAMPIPTSPWKGIGDGSAIRAENVVYERELLDAHRTEPTPASMALLGILYSQVGELTRGVAYLAASLVVEPESSIAWTWLGANRVEAGQLEDGAVLLERAVELDPENALAIKFLGVARARLGELESAKQAFEEVLRIDPESPDAMVELAALLEDEDESEAAFQLLLQAFRIRPEDDATVFRLARLARQLGREEEARQYELEHERLRVLEDLGFLDEKVSQATRSITLGIYFLDNGRVVEALPEFELVLEAEVEPAVRQNALLGRARCLVELKRFEEAEAAVQQLRDAHPDHLDLPALDARLVELRAEDE